ncbi:MAG: TetR/AcrR family transcriptional regulator [Pseudomonadota bacterium]
MRDKIISLAVEQLRAGGYKAVNFAVIADRLDTTRANLHHHFKNKEGLGIEATKAYLRDEEAAIEHILGQNEDDLHGFLKGLELHLIELVTTSVVQNPCVMSQILNDVEAPESLRKLVLVRCEEEQKTIEQQFSKARGKVALPEDRSDESLSYAVMATMFGIMQMGYASSDPNVMASYIEGAITSIAG